MNSKEILQYQLSNGSWIDCKDEENFKNFINRCIKFEKSNIEKVMEKLRSGKECRNDADDWYSVCRLKPIKKETVERPYDFPNGKKLICGCTVYYKSHIMHASLGKTCIDHYDDFS